MDTRRLFLAINLPSEIKEELLAYQKQYSDLPVRWTSKANLHVTLVFLGDTNSNQIKRVKQAIKPAQREFSEFSCELEKIVLAPPGSTPRMFWARLKKTASLLGIQKKLEKNLAEKPKTGYQEVSDRGYLPHITIGRIDQEKWKSLQDRPRVTKNLQLRFRVNSFELMESELKPSGAEYQVLNSFSLK